MQKMYLRPAGKLKSFIKLMVLLFVMGFCEKGFGQIIDDYRSVTGGTWLGAATATWQRYDGTVWNDFAAPANNTTNTIFIRHAVFANGSFASTIKIVVETGGTFTVTAASTTSSILINNGGLLQINAALTNTGSFTMESGGRTNLNHGNTSGISTLWNGIENFKAGSTFDIQDWRYNAPGDDDRLIQIPSRISINSGGFFFGNLIISGVPNSIFVICAGNQTISLSENDFISSSPSGNNVTFTTAESNITIGGNLIVTSDQFSFAASTTGNPVATINGNIISTGGTIDLNQNNSGATSTVQLKGNLNISAGTILRSTDLGGCKIVFSGVAEQTISISGTLGTNADFEIGAGANTKLINQNFNLVNASNAFDVLALGTLNFNGFDILGPGDFSQANTASLKITSALGINSLGNTGNVRNTGTRTFSQLGYFYFIGNSNPQATGFAITSGSTAKRIFIEKTNSTDIVNLSQSTGTSDQLTITTGTFVETATEFILSSGGALNMFPGGYYKILKGNSTAAASSTDFIPRLGGIYTLLGGTIEISNSGSADAFQTVRGTANYFNLIFSGANTLGLNYKNISSNTTINNKLEITGSAIVDCSDGLTNARSFTGAAGITMTGGRIRFLNRSNPQPELAGINTAYNLSSGVMEFYTSLPGGSASIKGTDGNSNSIIYNQIEITGNAVQNGAANITLGSGGTFSVKSSGTFEINDDAIVGPNGIQTVTIETGGTFKTGDVDGFAGGTITSIKNDIESVVLQPGSTVDYLKATGAGQIITNIGVTNPRSANYYNLVLSGTGTKTAPTSTLSILGNLIKSSTCTFAHNNGTVSIDGISATTQNYTSTTPVMEFCKLTNNNTAGGFTINGDLGVDSLLALSDNSKLIFGSGDVNIRSGSLRTGAIDQITPATAALINYTGSGRFQIERYLYAQSSWRFLSVPLLKIAQDINSPTINASWREGGTNYNATNYGTRITGPGAIALPNGVDEFTQRNSMKFYDMTSNKYIEIKSADLAANKTIANDEGYYVFVRGDRGINVPSGTVGATTLRARGKIRTGDQTYNVNTLSYQSIGNPYPSRLLFSSISKTANIENSYVAWNPSNIGGGYGVGRFEQYALIGSDYVGVYGTKNFIESGEAIFISSSNIGSGSITIKETDKAAGSLNFSRVGVNSPTLEINLFTKANDNTDYKADGTLLNFDPSFSNSINNEDVKKFSNASDNISVLNGNRKFFVERRNNLTSTDTIFLSLTNTRIAPYRFEIDPSVLGNLPLNAFLKDKFLVTETAVSLTGVTNVNFSITSDAASRMADRFMIVFKQAIPNGQLTGNFISIAVDKNADKTNALKWSYSNELNIAQYSIERSKNGTDFTGVGNQNAENVSTTKSYLFTDITNGSGTNYYKVKATSTTGQVQYSNTVKIVEPNVNPVFAVWPNPIVNKTMRISFENLEGNYSLKLVAKQGATVYSAQIAVASAKEVKNIAIGNGVAAGLYELVLINKAGKSLVQTVVVQ